MRTPQAKRPTRRETGAAEAVAAVPAPELAEGVARSTEEIVLPPGLEWSDEQTAFGRVISVRSGETTYSEAVDPAKPDVDAIKARLLARVAV